MKSALFARLLASPLGRAGGTRTGPTPSSGRLFGLAARFLALALFAAPLSAQTLVTDKDDYAPGETVYFAGSGFQAGETIGITLHVETSTDEVIDYAIGGIAVDPAGDFTASWLVPEEALDSVITATAIGLTSGRVATATFTDTVSSATVTSPTTGSPTTLTSLPATVTVSFTYSSSGAAGTTAEVNVPGVTSASKSVATGGTAASPLSDSINVVIPAGTVNGSYNVHLTVTNSSTPPGPTTRTDNHAGAIIVDVAPPPPPPCPTNAAPTISASNLDLGDIVGCLVGGSFQTSVSFGVADFNPVTNDPDGDPVTVTINVTSATLLGPGVASATATLTATDDPSGRNVAGCDPLTPLSASVDVTVTARVVYAFDGCLPPLTANGAGLFKRGSTIPIKFRLRDCNGIELCPSNFASLGNDACKPVLGAVVVSSLTPTGDAAAGDAGASNDNGLLFRYSGNCGVDGNWIYNLSTKEGGWTAGLTYKASITLDDGTTHCCFFTLKK